MSSQSPGLGDICPGRWSQLYHQFLCGLGKAIPKTPAQTTDSIPAWVLAYLAVEALKGEGMGAKALVQEGCLHHREPLLNQPKMQGPSRERGRRQPEMAERRRGPQRGLGLCPTQIK